MAVEQYVYMQIGCPDLEVVGEVVSPLNDHFLPEWINRFEEDIPSDETQRKHISAKIVMKGPCDLEQVFSFIHHGENILTEFTYVNDRGVSVEGHNHTGQIVTALSASEPRKREIINEIGWFDKAMLTTRLADKDVGTVVLSLLTDGNLGLYKRKATGELVALCEKCYDLTDPDTWELYINKTIFTSNIVFTRQELEKFSQLYEYVPNDGTLTIESLDLIYSRIKDKRLILILGSEQDFHGKTMPNYEGRAALHRYINGLVRQWAADKNNVTLLPLDRYILSEDDFLDTINHFKKSVYYRFAEDMVSILGDETEEMSLSGHGKLLYETLRQKAKLFLQKAGIR